MNRNKIAFLMGNKNVTLVVLIFCCILAILHFEPRIAAAQSPDPSWDLPVNLSNAGSSSGPAIVVDNDNRIHAVWTDEFSGTRYSQSVDGGEWSDPISVDFPFAPSIPRLIVGPGNYIYAFWRDTANNLYSSRVISENFSSLSAWENQGVLAQNTLAYDVLLGEDDVLHLVYVISTNADLQTSGVYYQRSSTGGTTWAASRQIYSSLYYRGMTADQAHVSVTLMKNSGAETIYAAWDDPFLRKILFSQSSDRGNKWEVPQEIDAPLSSSGLTTPSTVELTSWNDQIMMIWLNRSSQNICSILFQALTAGGSGWTSPQTILSNQSSCPSDSEFLAIDPDLLIWQATMNNQVYLVAWNGNQWSEPQVQTELASFNDPVTNLALTTGCRQIISMPVNNRLGSIACDENGNHDIWFTSRDTGEVNSWFPAGIVWGKTEELASISPVNAVVGLNVIADSQGTFHSFWMQPAAQLANATASTTPSIAIYYSKWTDGNWLEPVEIKRNTADSMKQLTAAIGSQNELYLVRQGELPGDFLFNKAQAARAYSQIEWSNIVKLPSAPVTSSSPSMAVGNQGELFVGYAVPVNENRGIYFIRSSDGGETWEQPRQIFDAQAAGWEMVNHPVLLTTGEGRLHALWRREIPLQDNMGLGLGYSYSDDAGNTWSEADLNVTGRKIRWAGLVQLEPGQLFRAWQELDNEQPVIFSQVSTDNGITWETPITIVNSGTLMSNPSLISNGSGSVHLLQINADTSGKKVIHHWIWDDNNWIAGDNLEIKQESIGLISNFSAGISFQDKIAAIYSAVDTFSNRQSIQAVLNFQGDTSQSPASTVAPRNTPEPPAPTPSSSEESTDTPQITATEINTEVPESTSTTGPEQTQTVDLSGGENSANPSGTNAWTGLILGIILAGAIMIAVIGYRLLLSGPNEAQRKKKP